MARSDVSVFLQARRARLTPAEVGLRPAPGQRRVPGLRREELAQLAGLSVDYYVQLEQGRRPRASQDVLDGLGRALRLTPVEREHLGALVAAGGTRPAADRTARSDSTEIVPRAAASRTARPAPAHPMQQLLDLLDRVPAVVLGRRMDVLAYNSAADAVFEFASWPAATPAATLNGAREVFARPDDRRRYPDWQHMAEEIVANLHRDAGQHPTDRRLSALVGELSVASEDFRQLWARHDVRRKDTGPSRLVHPLVGELTFAYRALSAHNSDDELLITYTYPVGSPTDERLRMLMSWTASPDQVAEQYSDPR